MSTFPFAWESAITVIFAPSLMLTPQIERVMSSACVRKSDLTREGQRIITLRVFSLVEVHPRSFRRKSFRKLHARSETPSGGMIILSSPWNRTQRHSQEKISSTIFLWVWIVCRLGYNPYTKMNCASLEEFIARMIFFLLSPLQENVVEKISMSILCMPFPSRQARAFSLP